MLRVSLADVREHAVETMGAIPLTDPMLTGNAGDDVVAVAPLDVHGRLSSAGEGRYYWKVTFATTVRAECRRCLVPVDVPVRETLGVVFAEGDEDAEAEGFYVVPARARELDLRDALAEEYRLALPHFVECRPECRGLCATCGANLNDGPCRCAGASDPRWDALRALTQPDSTTD